jgi:hypothetical protein
MKPAIEPPEIVNKRRLGGVVSRPHAAIDKPSVDFRGSPPFFPVLCHAMPRCRRRVPPDHLHETWQWRGSPAT